MEKKTNSNKLAGVGFITAIAASLCCITPVFALISGASGIASAFSRLEPFRPYFIGLTLLVLGFAWYQKLKPKKKEQTECACEDDEKSNFRQSKKFLIIITVFAAVMTAFPYYSEIFYPKAEKNTTLVSQENIQEINLNISGMTCTGCEQHIKHAVLGLNGVLNANASYTNGNAQIKFDKSEISEKQIIEAVNETGYKVINTKNE